jgi:DNA invertase Pin-like site-specific DNA recombinase
MAHQNIGYIRVSSADQNADRQLVDLQLNKTFTDQITGSIKDRPKLNECIDYIRHGDTLYVHSIDRLARNLLDLQEIIQTIIQKGVILKFVKENLVFTSINDPMATLTLQIMGAFAEFERTMIRTRQREGINAAKKAGKHLGRPHKIDNKFRKIVKEKLENCQSIRSIAKDMSVSRATIYKAIEQLKSQTTERND